MQHVPVGGHVLGGSGTPLEEIQAVFWVQKLLTGQDLLGLLYQLLHSLVV